MTGNFSKRASTIEQGKPSHKELKTNACQCAMMGATCSCQPCRVITLVSPWCWIHAIIAGRKLPSPTSSRRVDELWLCTHAKALSKSTIFFCRLKQETVPKINGFFRSGKGRAWRAGIKNWFQSTAARMIECLFPNRGKNLSPVFTSSEETQIKCVV